MSRLDEIKENLETVERHRDRIEPYEYVEDVKYLLNEVDRLKSALESVRNAPAREIMRNYAERALNEEHNTE